MSWKHGFTKFLGADPQRLHFAAHSHHFWPDVTFEAHQQAWLMAARYADEKWDPIFGEVLPETQRHIAEELSLPSSDSLVFAPNTHEFVLRLLSCLPERAHVVTTDSEFHSFERQSRRLEEEGLLRVTRVPSEPFASFNERFSAAAQQADLVFFSHVFFNSGAVVQQLDSLVDSLPKSAMVVIDGYHGFCAVPTSLERLSQRAFYLAGGYKYAMSGEGACFMHVPPSALELRPRNTGWFAAFDALAGKRAGEVPYSKGAMRFMGATFDPSGLFRFNATMRWRKEVKLSTPDTRAHAHSLQHHFVSALPEGPLKAEQLLVPIANPARGQFLTFRTPDANALCATLKLHHVITDSRDDRLRFGFAPYHDEADVVELHARLARALK